MNWQKLVEERIGEAFAQGEFDDLPGRGQPLDLTDYFALPAAERAGVQVLKNAKVLPPEMELLKKIAGLEAALAACQGAAQRRRMETELQEKRVGFAMAMERRKRREPAI